MYIRGHGGLTSDTYGVVTFDLANDSAFVWLNSEAWYGFWPRQDPGAVFTVLHELAHVVCDSVVLDAAETDLPDHVHRRMDERAERFAFEVFAAHGWELPDVRRWGLDASAYGRAFLAGAVRGLDGARTA